MQPFFYVLLLFIVLDPILIILGTFGSLICNPNSINDTIRTTPPNHFSEIIIDALKLVRHLAYLYCGVKVAEDIIERVGDEVERALDPWREAATSERGQRRRNDLEEGREP